MDLGLHHDIVLPRKALLDSSLFRPQHPVGMKISVMIKHVFRAILPNNFTIQYNMNSVCGKHTLVTQKYYTFILLLPM